MASSNPADALNPHKQGAATPGGTKNPADAFNPSKAAPVSTGGHGPTSPILKALSILDTPRAAIVSAIHEGADARFEGGNGAHWSDFVKQVQEHKGVGDYVHTGNQWADRALGFAGDVAADPLTYVSGGAVQAGRQGVELTAEGAARRLLADEAVNKLGEQGAKDAAARVLKAKSASVLQSHELEAIGAKSGIKFAGGIIPGTEGAQRALGTVKGAVKAAAVEHVPGLDALGRTFASSPVLREAAKTDPVGAFQVKEALRATPVLARTEKQSMLTELAKIQADHFDGVDHAEVARVMEGAATTDPKVQAAADALKGWFDTAASRGEELTGRVIPRRENYLPWVMTDEAKAGADATKSGASRAAGRGKQAFELRADLLGADAEWMGHKLTGSPAERRAQVEALAQSHFGVKLLKDDPITLAEGYANGMQRYIRNYGQVKALEDAGLAVPTRMEEVVNKKAGSLRKTLSNQLNDALAEHGAATDQLTEAAARLRDARGGVPPEADALAAEGEAAKAASATPVDTTEVDKLTQAVETLKGKITAQPVAADTSALKTKLDEATAKLAKAEDGAATLREAAPSVNNGTDAIAKRAAELHAELSSLPTEDVLKREEVALKLEHRKLSSGAHVEEARQQFEALKSEMAQRTQAGDDAAALSAEYAPKINEIVQAANGGDARIEEINGRLVQLDNVRQRQREILKEAAGLKAGKAPKSLADKLRRYIAAAESDLQNTDKGLAAKDVRSQAEKALPKLREQLAEAESGKTAATVESAHAKQVAAAEAKVTKARAVVAQHQAAFDAAGVATAGISPAEHESLAAELTDLQSKLAEAKGAQATKLAEQAAHAEKAKTLFEHADALRAAGHEDLSVIANLEAMFQQAEVHQAQSVKDSIALLAMHDSVKGTKWVPADMLQDGLKELANGKWAEPWVVDAVNEVHQFLQPKAVPRWLKTVDWITSRWKAYNLLTPGFHTRNYFGGLFNNQLAGVDRESYVTFARAWRKVSKQGIDSLPEGEMRDAFQHMLDHEVLNGGQFHEAVDAGASTGGGLFHRVGVPDKFDPTSLHNGLINVSRRAGEGVENNLRGVLFLDRYLKTGKWQEALEAVAKYHFDYGDLSQFEKTYLKRAIPFYTWTRKNFPLQLEMMAKRPGAYTTFLHAKQNIELGVPEDGVVPAYYGSLLAIRSPFKAASGGRMYFTPDTPFRDLAETFDVNKVIGSLNPLAKVPLESAANKQFYSQIPFNGTPKPVPLVFLPVAEILRPMGGKFGLPKVMAGKGGQLYMSDKDSYKVESMLPLLGKLRRAAPSEKKYQDRALTSWLSLLAGFGSRTLSQSEVDGELLRRSQQTKQKNKLAKALGYDG